MRKQLLLAVSILTIGIASCSGNHADGRDSAKDTTSKYTGDGRYATDSTTKDTTGKDPHADSTTNAPRMPGH